MLELLFLWKLGISVCGTFFLIHKFVVLKRMCGVFSSLGVFGFDKDDLFFWELGDLKIFERYTDTLDCYDTPKILILFLSILERTKNSRKTNNTSFECPNWLAQNTRRTDLQLFQGLSSNLFFKKCTFSRKVARQSLIELQN